MKVAVLADAPNQIEVIGQVLTSCGYHFHVFRCEKEFIKSNQNGADLLIIGRQTSNRSAADVLLKIGAGLANNVPVLSIIDSNDVANFATGLAVGTEDYIVTPIRPAELQLRVRVLLRRTHLIHDGRERMAFEHDLFDMVDTRSGHLTLFGQTTKVPQKEFRLALLLFKNMGLPVSRAHIQDMIWPDHDASKIIDKYISRIRNRFQLIPGNGYLLTSVHGYGYQLDHIGKLSVNCDPGI
jgi:DNA-binding response OmpR family regulator